MPSRSAGRAEPGPRLDRPRHRRRPRQRCPTPGPQPSGTLQQRDRGQPDLHLHRARPGHRHPHRLRRRHHRRLPRYTDRHRHLHQGHHHPGGVRRLALRQHHRHRAGLHRPGERGSRPRSRAARRRHPLGQPGLQRRLQPVHLQLLPDVQPTRWSTPPATTSGRTARRPRSSAAAPRSTSWPSCARCSSPRPGNTLGVSKKAVLSQANAYDAATRRTPPTSRT